MMRPEIESAVTLILSIIAGALGLATYAWTNFQTKDAALQNHQMIERRLDRIEVKLDRLVEYPRR